MPPKPPPPSPLELLALLEAHKNRVEVLQQAKRYITRCGVSPSVIRELDKDLAAEVAARDAVLEEIARRMGGS